MSTKPLFNKGQLVRLAENCPYVVSTATKRNLFEIKPDMLGLFLGYCETGLPCHVAVVLFEDVTVAISADRLVAHHV